MAKYKVGDKLMHSQESVGDTVDLDIIFVPPLEYSGIQRYLCTVSSVNLDGAEEMFVKLMTEQILDGS